MPVNHLILCRPLPPTPPSIRVFSNESALRIRWPKYWSFSFNISPSNEHPGLISFRMNCWISLQSKGLSRVFSNTTVQKHQFFGAQLTKGTFHAKMGSIKDRNGRDLTEAEDIKKRWQEYTEELYKKDLHNPDNHNGVIAHLETDFLECEVKWALGSITMNKGSGCDGIPVELFQIMRDDAVKVLHSIYQQIWKTQQ